MNNVCNKKEFLLKGIEEVEKCARELTRIKKTYGLYGTNSHMMDSKDFLNVFSDFTLIDRHDYDFAFELRVSLGKYKVCSLLSDKRYHTLKEQGVFDDIEVKNYNE